MSLLINSYSYATGGGVDVTPDALTASYNATYDSSITPPFSNAYFQINGITTSITIRFVSSELGVGGLKAYYYITNNGAAWAQADIGAVGTQIASLDTISISDGDYLVIGLGSEPLFETGGTLTIYNESDGDTQLTYINMSASPGGGGPPE